MIITENNPESPTIVKRRSIADNKDCSNSYHHDHRGNESAKKTTKATSKTTTTKKKQIHFMNGLDGAPVSSYHDVPRAHKYYLASESMRNRLWWNVHEFEMIKEEYDAEYDRLITLLDEGNENVSIHSFRGFEPLLNDFDAIDDARFSLLEALRDAEDMDDEDEEEATSQTQAVLVAYQQFVNNVMIPAAIRRARIDRLSIRSF